MTHERVRRAHGGDAGDGVRARRIQFRKHATRDNRPGLVQNQPRVHDRARGLVRVETNDRGALAEQPRERGVAHDGVIERTLDVLDAFRDAPAPLGAESPRERRRGGPRVVDHRAVLRARPQQTLVLGRQHHAAAARIDDRARDAPSRGELEREFAAAAGDVDDAGAQTQLRLLLTAILFRRFRFRVRRVLRVDDGRVVDVGRARRRVAVAVAVARRVRRRRDPRPPSLLAVRPSSLPDPQLGR
eukprot:30936-Pelagococcus_subviridis.AAC.1